MTRQSHTAANTHAAAPVVRIPDERLARISRRSGDAFGPRWSGFRPEPVSRLGHSATIAIAARLVRDCIMLLCVAYAVALWVLP